MAVEEVRTGVLRPERFKEVMEPDRWERFSEAMAEAKKVFDGRRVWNINSTATGGGVAYMVGNAMAHRILGGVVIGLALALTAPSIVA